MYEYECHNELLLYELYYYITIIIMNHLLYELPKQPPRSPRRTSSAAKINVYAKHHRIVNSKLNYCSY